MEVSEKQHFLSVLLARMVNNHLPPCMFSTTEYLQWRACTLVRRHPLQYFEPEMGGGHLPQGGSIPQTLWYMYFGGAENNHCVDVVVVVVVVIVVAVVSGRLCARNIPRSVSDDQLRKVFSTCLGKGKPIRVTKVR